MECFQLHKPHPLYSCRLPSRSMGIRGSKHQLIIKKYNNMPIFLRIWGSLGHKVSCSMSTTLLSGHCSTTATNTAIRKSPSGFQRFTFHKVNRAHKRMDSCSSKRAPSLWSWYRTRSFDWRQAVKQSYNAYSDYTDLDTHSPRLIWNPTVTISSVRDLTRWLNDLHTALLSLQARPQLLGSEAVL